MFFFCLVLACPALNVVFSSPSHVRRKSKQAMRDYKKVQIQLENLETSVRDRCKKEFTGVHLKNNKKDSFSTFVQQKFLLFPPDLMTEMMDMSSDLVGSGIPFLDYRAYAERIFFPGHQESPLRRDLDIPESRRQTVEQGLVQLSNLLNSKLFLIKVSLRFQEGLDGFSRSASHLLCCCSLFTLWRPSAPSRRGTGPTWHHCSRWPCTASWSTSQTS